MGSARGRRLGPPISRAIRTLSIAPRSCGYSDESETVLRAGTGDVAVAVAEPRCLGGIDVERHGRTGLKALERPYGAEGGALAQELRSTVPPTRASHCASSHF